MMETWRNAVWLAGKDVQRTWLSYLATGVLVLFFSLIATSFFGLSFRDAAGGVGDVSTMLASNIFFLAAGSALAVNSLSRDYLYSWGQDSFSRRATFLKGLPIAVPEMVANRLLTLLLALVVNTALFFTPPYLLAGTLRAELSPAEYSGFVAVWTGYALLWAGFYIYMEFGTNGKIYNFVMLFALLLILVVGGVPATVFEFSLITSVAEVVLRYRPVAAVPALLVGMFVLAACYRATVRRLEKRNLTV